MIPLAITLIRNSLNFWVREGKKNKVEALGIRGESIFLPPPPRPPYIPH